MGISCLLYRNKLAALTSNALPEALAARVERHLRVCPDCLSEWAAQQRMAAALRQATPTAALPSPTLWERLEVAIEAEAAPPAPARVTPRRLAPLGGLALAGAAAAALLVARPQVRVTAPMTSPAPQQAPQIALAPKPSPSPAPKAPSALQLAQQSERLVVANKPAKDPFASQQPEGTAPDLGTEVVRRVRLSRPQPRTLKALPLPEPKLPSRAEKNAVALLEVGMHRVVEESQTEELNRLVAEAERHEPGASQRASCPATDATVSAQHTQGSLFQ